MILEITYEDWKECYVKNIKPLPVWWNCEKNRKYKYNNFIHFCQTGEIK